MLGEYQGDKFKLLFTWSIIALKRIMESPLPAGEQGNAMLFNEHEQTALVNNVKDEIVGMRGAIGSISNSLIFPFPWPYYHIVVCIVNVQLLFLSISTIKLTKDSRCSPVSMITLPVICYVFAAITGVATAMTDPFGDDVCDFNKKALVENVFNDCKKLAEEKDEDFLASIGDPRFNPTRNKDGSLQEADDTAAGKPEVDVPPPTMIPQSEVQIILDEKAALEEELRIGGVSKLTKAVRALATTVDKMVGNQRKSQQDFLKTGDAIAEIQGQIKQMAIDCNRISAISADQMDRVTRLETLQAHSLLTNTSESKGTTAKP